MPSLDDLRVVASQAIRRLAAFLSRRQPLPVWFVVLLLLVLVAGVGLAYVNYAPEANVVCTTCHNMVPFYEGIADTSHGSINCHVCHPLSAAVIGELVVQLTEAPSPAEIKERASKKISMYEPCLSCHRLSELRELRIHEAHLTMAVEVLGSCDICHNPHDPGELPDACTRCHRLGRAIDVHSAMHDEALARFERGEEGVCYECHSDIAEWEVPMAASCLEGLAEGKTCFDCHEPPLDPPMIRDVPCTQCHSS